MNEYLASPVTPIVIVVLAIAIAVGVTLTVMSRRKKRRLRAEQERRRAEIRVAQQLEAERQAVARRLRAASEKSKVLKRPRLYDERDVRSRANTTNLPRNTVRLSDVVTGQAKVQRSRPAPQRSATSGTTGDSRRYDPSTDNLAQGMMMGGAFGFLAADSGGSNDNSSRDSGSSHGHGGGSTGSSGDSGSSGGSSDSGGGWGGDSGGGGDF